jgi:hypothetical protein
MTHGPQQASGELLKPNRTRDAYLNTFYYRSYITFRNFISLARPGITKHLITIDLVLHHFP